MNGDSPSHVVVTGGTGFFGQYIYRVLREQGIGCTALGSRDFDLTEQASVRSLYRELRPEVIVHAAAACGGIGANVANPGRFLYENATMGLQLLEEGRKAGLQKFVLISTTCAYPEQAPMPLREADLWNGAPTSATGPYGIAKRMLHEACRSYRKQYGLESNVLIPANLYGPGDHFDPENSHVIAALIRRYVEAVERQESEVTNWGSGKATREFLHVADAAEAVRLAVIKSTDGDPINLGTGRETSIAELAGLVAQAAGYQGITRWDTAKPDGQPRRYLDVSRARDVLGFEARVPLEQGIGETVEWFVRQQRGQ